MKSFPKTIFLCLSLLSFTDLFAAALSVSPSYFELDSGQGQSVEQRLVIYNSSMEAMRVKLYVGDFWYDKAGKRTFPHAGSSAFSGASWIEIPEREVELGPKSQKELKLIVSIPPKAPPSAYASVFVERLGKTDVKKDDGGSVSISLRIAVPVLYRRPDSTAQKVNIEKFKVSKPSQFKPLVITFLLNNEDDVYLFPKGDVLVVKEPSKSLVAKGELQKERLLLPKQKVDFELPISMEVTKGTYEGLLTVFYGNDKNLVKRFTFNIP